MRADQNIRQALCMSQEAFAVLLSVSESLVSLRELGLRRYPHEPYMKEMGLLQAFLQAEPEIPLPNDANYAAMLRTKMGNQPSFLQGFAKQKRSLEHKLRKAQHGIFTLSHERERRFEKFQDLWLAMQFLEKHMPTVADEHDSKFLGNALFLATWNAEKEGRRLMQIDSDLILLHAEETALKNCLAKLEDLPEPV